MTNFKKIIIAGAVLVSANMSIAGEKVLKIGVEGAYPPFSKTNKDNEVVGFDIDIANALCAEMKRKCKLVKVDWDGMIPALKGRKIDAIIASMDATEERRKSIDFTRSYYRIPVKTIRKKGSDLEFTVESMKGKTIGVQGSTTFDKEMTKKFGDVATIKRYISNDEALIDLKAGKVDAVPAESLVLADFLKKESNYEFFGPDIYLGDGISIGLRKKQDELKESFNKAIEAIRANGEYKKINDKYFEVDIYGE